MFEVRDFLRRHLEAQGCVAEADDLGLRVLLTPEVASTLGAPEEAHLLTETPSDGGQPGALDAQLGTALLDRAVAARRESRPVATVALAGELPRPLGDGVPVLLNAVRSGPPGPRERRPARYLRAELRIALTGDEVRSVARPVTLRLDDGALVADLPLGAAYRVPSAALTAAERAAASTALRRAVARAAPAALASALDAIGRRARRDLGRVAEYYASLDAEMARAAARARSEDERARRAAKRALLPDELGARRVQIRDRLAARIGGELLAAVVIETEADFFEIPVKRRARTGAVVVRRRAADGSLEGPPCAGCGDHALKLYLCDESLHVLCRLCGDRGRLERTRCMGCRPRPIGQTVVSVEDPTASLRLGSAGDTGVP